MQGLSIFIISFFTFSALAADTTDFGKELKLAIHENGQPAFGATYTYGDDPDGKSYLLTFSPDVSPTEKSAKFLWNFYIEDSGYLLQWDPQKVTSLAAVQVFVKEASVVESILKNQGLGGHKKSVYFILADSNTTKAVYYLPVSKLCTELPTHFSDLTNGNSCDKISNP